MRGVVTGESLEVGWVSHKGWEGLLGRRQSDRAAIARDEASIKGNVLFLIALVFTLVVEDVLVELPALVKVTVLALQLKHGRDVHARTDQALG